MTIYVNHPVDPDAKNPHKPGWKFRHNFMATVAIGAFDEHVRSAILELPGAGPDILHELSRKYQGATSLILEPEQPQAEYIETSRATIPLNIPPPCSQALIEIYAYTDTYCGSQYQADGLHLYLTITALRLDGMWIQLPSEE